MNHFYKKILLLFCLVFGANAIIAQQDTIRKISFSGIPVVASSPETGFKYGVFGQVSFDLMKNNIESRPSQAKIGITHSVKKQLSIETAFLLFGKDEKYFIRFNPEYQNWIDRHYGLGNDASNVIVEYNANKQETLDTLNYLNYKINVFQSQLSYNQQLKPGFFVGILTHFYHAANFESLADSVLSNSPEIKPADMLGEYLGVGLNLTYDTRNNINTPLKGSYVQFSNVYYQKWLGADYQFSVINFDARQYFNLVKDQILALRLQWASTISKERIPYTAYQRLGGKSNLRGYYNGTYLDKNLLSFDVEYRLPLWQEESEPIWKIWKHMGMVGFVNGGQVFDDVSALQLSDFRFSAGGGLRLLLSKEQRTNIRIDYGLGFQENAGGINKKQRGLYITVNETF